MIDDISTVLSPSYHVSQSLVILQEIIRVALVSVVFLLRRSQDNKTNQVSLVLYLVSPAGAAVQAALAPEAFPGWRLTDFAGNCHHLHWQEIILPRLPARLDEESEVVGLAQVGLREPQLLAGCLLPVHAGSPGPE